MTETLTAAQMRAVEKAAMDAGFVTGATLMERAARGVIEAAFAHWPDYAIGAHDAIVLCGPGNNGGDGFGVARLLHSAGWSVAVYAQGWDDLAARSGDAAANARQWVQAGGPIHPLGDLPRADLGARGPVLVVDALLGIGQNRRADDILRPYHAARARWNKAEPVPVVRRVSVDTSTGFDCDTGQPLADAPFDADLVVTFHRFKPVHSILRQKGVKVVVASIGL